MGIFPIGSLVELSTGSIGVVITINRARRLKPKVVLLLTANKKPLSQRVIADLAEHRDSQGKELKINARPLQPEAKPARQRGGSGRPRRQAAV